MRAHAARIQPINLFGKRSALRTNKISAFALTLPRASGAALVGDQKHRANATIASTGMILLKTDNPVGPDRPSLRNNGENELGAGTHVSPLAVTYGVRRHGFSPSR